MCCRIVSDVCGDSPPDPDSPQGLVSVRPRPPDGGRRTPSNPIERQFVYLLDDVLELVGDRLDEPGRRNLLRKVDSRVKESGRVPTHVGRGPSSRLRQRGGGIESDKQSGLCGNSPALLTERRRSLPHLPQDGPMSVGDDKVAGPVAIRGRSVARIHLGGPDQHHRVAGRGWVPACDCRQCHAQRHQGHDGQRDCCHWPTAPSVSPRRRDRRSRGTRRDQAARVSTAWIVPGWCCRRW